MLFCVHSCYSVFIHNFTLLLNIEKLTFSPAKIAQNQKGRFIFVHYKAFNKTGPNILPCGTPIENIKYKAE